MFVAQAAEGIAIAGVVMVPVVVGVACFATDKGGKAAAQLLECVPTIGFQIMAALAGFKVGLIVLRRAGDDVDHPAYGLVAIQNSAGAAQNLDTFDSAQWHAVKVRAADARVV